MFRLVKIIGSSNTYEETVRLPNNNKTDFTPGSALVCSNGTLVHASSDSFPDYIFTKHHTKDKSIATCYQVSDDMIFKVEYVSAIAPKIGMKIGISNSKGSANSVTYNSSGKGMVTELGKTKNTVYVKFQRI